MREPRLTDVIINVNRVDSDNEVTHLALAGSTGYPSADVSAVLTLALG